MLYAPSFFSMIRSVLYRFSVGILVLLAMYFIGETAGRLFWIVSWIFLIFAILMALEALLVHTNKLHIDGYQISSKSLLAKNGVTWNQVTRAELRERENVLSGVDRLLILQSQHNMFSYPLSILKTNDQEHIIQFVRDKVNNLIVVKDKPTL